MFDQGGDWMRRVILTALVLAVLPAAAFAQTPPARAAAPRSGGARAARGPEAHVQE